LKNVLLSVILSAIVSYAVSYKVSHKEHDALMEEVDTKITDVVEQTKANDDFRGEQFADLNARCYFALNELDDMNHMIVTNSRETQENKKDIDTIIKLLVQMRKRQK
jgi:hypothetical protein